MEIIEDQMTIEDVINSLQYLSFSEEQQDAVKVLLRMAYDIGESQHRQKGKGGE